MSAIAVFALALPAGAEEIGGFWKATLTRLAGEPLEATTEDTHEPLPYKTFRVEYRSLDGVRVRAFLALPIRGGEAPRPLRAIVTIPGYGGLQQGIMLSECQRGYAILQVYPRSQGPSADLWKIDGPDKLTWRLSSGGRLLPGRLFGCDPWRRLSGSSVRHRP